MAGEAISESDIAEWILEKADEEGNYSAFDGWSSADSTSADGWLPGRKYTIPDNAEAAATEP